MLLAILSAKSDVVREGFGATGDSSNLLIAVKQQRGQQKWLI